MHPLVHIFHFFNRFWIASRLGCSLFEAMPGSLSVGNTAVSSANGNVVDSGVVGRCTVYSRYRNGSRTLPWDTPALTGRVLHTHFQLSRESVCYAIRI
jgi:hypothetical protein